MLKGILSAPNIELHPGEANKRRETWMDLARGAAILAVILFHSATFPVRHGLEPYIWYVDLNDSLRMFRMPLLVFLSGMLLGRSLNKDPLAYVIGKFKGIVWPYLVWTSIYILLVETENDSLKRIFVDFLGGTYLWYLAFIFLYYMAALLLRRINPILVAILAFSIAFASPDGSKYLERFFFLMSFFFAGSAAATYARCWKIVIDSIWTWICCAFVVVGCWISYNFGTSYGPDYILIIAGGVVFFCRAFSAISKVSAGPATGALSWVGRNSIVFYVTHVPAIYLTAGALSWTSPSQFGLVATACVTSALVTGYLMTIARDRYAFARVAFVPPKI